MSLTLITAPTTEPLTIAEAKRQLLLNETAGEPAPSAPTAALISPAAAGNVDNGVHRYAVTFVTADGETELGTVSATVTVADKTVNGKVSLTAIALGGSAVTSRKLYRTAAGGSTYLLLATISNNTATTYTDNVADSSLGAQAPTTNTTNDPELTRSIASVRDRAEQATGRALITQTWDLVFDEFPSGTYIEIPKPPLQSVTHLKYSDSQGTLTTWAASNYVVQAPSGPRAASGRLALAFGVTWPTTYGQMGDVTVRFIAGYGAAAAVPGLLKAAMLLDLAALYANRDQMAEMPTASRELYRAFRVYARQQAAA